MRHAIAFVLLCSVTFAEKPKPCIDGPREVHCGALVTLDASQSAGAETWGWLVDTSAVKVPGSGTPDVSRQVSELRSLGFTVSEPDADEAPLYEVEDGGKRLRLSSFSGTYRVVLAVGNADGVSLIPWTVEVDGAAPTPVPPKPNPPVPPTPDVEPNLPAGQFGLAIKSWRAAQRVQSATRQDEAKQLATALLLALTAADGQGMVDQFAASMKTQFTAAQKTAWEPWRAAYIAELTALQGAGKLNDKAAFASAFTEMSLGLAAVEK